MRALFKDEDKLLIREADKNEVTLVKLFLENTKKEENSLIAKELYGVDAEVTGILFENKIEEKTPTTEEEGLIEVPSISVGDELTDKVFNFEFPDSLEDEEIQEGENAFITFANGSSIVTNKTALKLEVHFKYNDETYVLYSKVRDTATKILVNSIKFAYPELVVTEIDQTNPAYNYVGYEYIKSDEIV